MTGSSARLDQYAAEEIFAMCPAEGSGTHTDDLPGKLQDISPPIEEEKYIAEPRNNPGKPVRL